MVFYLKSGIKPKLFPHQLGVSTPSGAEANIHSAHSFCASSNQSIEPIAFLKVDFENAFNTIRRDKFLEVIKNKFGCANWNKTINAILKKAFWFSMAPF